MLAVWDIEKFPKDPVGTMNYLGLIILIGALIAARKKIGAVPILLGSGIAGIVLGFIF